MGNHTTFDPRGESAGRIYPCAECGKMRSKAEGGTTFTVCDECWDKKHPDTPTLREAQERAEAANERLQTIWGNGLCHEWLVECTAPLATFEEFLGMLDEQVQMDREEQSPEFMAMMKEAVKQPATRRLKCRPGRRGRGWELRAQMFTIPVAPTPKARPRVVRLKNGASHNIETGIIVDAEELIIYYETYRPIRTEVWAANRH